MQYRANNFSESHESDFNKGKQVPFGDTGFKMGFGLFNQKQMVNNVTDVSDYVEIVVSGYGLTDSVTEDEQVDKD